jgi:hypothetical protein
MQVSTELMDCGGCGSSSYCNAECQRNDWRQHKAVCVGRKASTAKLYGQENVGTTMPEDIKYKCDFLRDNDERMRAGKAVFGRVIEADELGWEDNSVDLRLNKLHEHITKLGYSDIDFWSAIKLVISKRSPENVITRDRTLTVKEKIWAHQYQEMLAVCSIVGFSEEEGKRAVNTVCHWRRVPSSY